jgi:HrpA-like RNA helicase
LVVLPRKLSVIASATRVASELQSPLGSIVGYSLRMDSKISSQTRIKFITYRSFLREVQLDPRLSCYSVVMFDDAHEMSLEFELSLFLLKRIVSERNLKDYPDHVRLKVIITSATLQVDALKEYFQESRNLKSNIMKKSLSFFKKKNLKKKKESKLKIRILQIKGRNYPVKITYLKQKAKNIHQACIDITISLLSRIKNSISGENFSKNDILIFFSGKEEIDKFIQSLFNELKRCKSIDFLCNP